MADRADSVPLAYSIDVPTMFIAGEEDTVTGVAEAEMMKQSIGGKRYEGDQKAGHYSPWSSRKRWDDYYEVSSTVAGSKKAHLPYLGWALSAHRNFG
jgi:pimeloyl-ACP methyl ester carboxylesterase